MTSHARAGLAFVGQATISVVSSQQVERRTFTGLVDQVESNGDGTVTLRLRGREAVLEDQPMAGLTVFEGTDPPRGGLQLAPRWRTPQQPPRRRVDAT